MTEASVIEGRYGRTAVLRLKPNQDLIEGLEAACREHGIARAVIRSALARRQQSIMVNSSIRLSLTGGQVGCTRKTSRPRTSSSNLQKLSPSGNVPKAILAGSR